MHFKTTDGFQIVTKGNGWTDGFVEFKKIDHTDKRTLVLPLYGEWIHEADESQLAEFYASENASHNAMSKLDDLNPDGSREFMVHSTDEYDAEFRIFFDDTELNSLDDTITHEPLCGDLSRNDGTWLASIDEDEEDNLLITFNLEECDGSEIVALHYPKYDCEKETIVSQSGKLVTATYPPMKSVQLVIGDSREVIYLVPDYDRDGDVNFLVLPKNDFIPDSVTDEINFAMIDGCETSGTVGAVKWSMNLREVF